MLTSESLTAWPIPEFSLRWSEKEGGTVEMMTYDTGQWDGLTKATITELKIARTDHAPSPGISSKSAL
jgi:hypothetical protein